MLEVHGDRCAETAFRGHVSFLTDARLHAKVPLVALLGLMHGRIARPVAVLGRRRGGDQPPVKP